MKKILLAILIMICSVVVSGQPQSPVSWTVSAIKSVDGNYKITINASVPGPWHIYSQATPSGGPVPTTISFNKNPLITIIGKTDEIGKLKTTHDKNFGVNVKYYSGKVAFIQVVKVKANVKTNLTGSVNFMVCNDSECLPPSNWEFSVLLN